MIEYPLEWDIDEMAAEALQREYVAIATFVMRDRETSPAVRMMAMAEVLALAISWQCRNDDEATTCSFVDFVADNIKQTVRRLKTIPAPGKNEN